MASSAQPDPAGSSSSRASAGFPTNSARSDSLVGRRSQGFDVEERDDFSVDRLRWLIRLRWIALSGISLAALLSGLGYFPGVQWPVLVATVVGVGVYNFVLHRRHIKNRTSGEREALRQAIVDMLLLTVVLWAAGGMRTPFIGFYVFHVAIVGILGGTRATLTAVVAAAVGALLLLITEYVPALRIGQWRPEGSWGLASEGFAFIATVGSVAYLVTHAVSGLRLRERALAEARARAALELEVLTNTLDQLEAGLEVRAADVIEDLHLEDSVIWRNRRAEALAPSIRPWLDESDDDRKRFAAKIEGRERVYERLGFELGRGPDGALRFMYLYVDRTTNLITERQMLLAERLASLGRVTQGVAHELNTPLATIRTLAADMVAALRNVSPDKEAREGLFADLSESAALVHDETRRLGRITQGLLTGRDLVSIKTEGMVSLGFVVERARTLVFAGVRAGISVDLGEGLDEHAAIGDPDQLVQVMVNLLQNAYDAVRDAQGGGVRVYARRTADRVELVIDDDGPGLRDDMRGRLFEPFATTKPPGKGTGLGLYTSYMLVDGMRGTLTLENRREGGARAVVSLPAARHSEAAE